MTEATQEGFTLALGAATERLWLHRKALKRVAVRIGFWPDGMVISANITARNNDELRSNLAPRVIPWMDVANITQGQMVAIGDELCSPLYPALGLKQGEDRSTTAQIVFARRPDQTVWVSGFTADELGVPMVAVGGGIDCLEQMTPARADEFADGLKRAASLARGETVAL